MREELKRETHWQPGYDSKEHGVHPMHLVLVVSGMKGAVTCDFNTGWYPYRVQFEEEPKWRERERGFWVFDRAIKPECWGVALHSLIPAEGFAWLMEGCKWTKGVCHSAEIGLREKMTKVFLEDPNKVFEELEGLYRERLEVLPWPPQYDGA